jgi:hypothetical protein
MRPLWSKESCWDCGKAGYATRTESRPADDPYYCEECEIHREYQPRISELEERVKELEASCEAKDAALREIKAERDVAKAELRKTEENLAQPDWCCAECGSTEQNGIVYPSTPNSPEEYDMECSVCGSMEIAESCMEAASTLGDKLDTCRAERDEAKAKLEAATERTEEGAAWRRQFEDQQKRTEHASSEAIKATAELKTATKRAEEAEKHAEQRCIKHAAYNPEGDCVYCDVELAQAQAQRLREALDLVPRLARWEAQDILDKCKHGNQQCLICPAIDCCDNDAGRVLKRALVETESKAAPEQPRKAPVNDKEPSMTENQSAHNNGELLGAAAGESVAAVKGGQQ